MSFNTIGLVFVLHLLVGALIGFGIASILFVGISVKPKLFGSGPRSYGVMTIRYAPVWGLVAGFILWTSLFLPTTYNLIIPLLNSISSNTIVSGHARTGELVVVEKNQLLQIMNQIIIASVAFHLFYGMTTVVLIRAMYESHGRREKSKENEFAPVREFFTG